MPDDRQTSQAPEVTDTASPPGDARTTPLTEEQYTVPIVQAAFRLKLGRQSAYDAVLRGDLNGMQKNDGRWYVTPDSLEKLAVSRGL